MKAITTLFFTCVTVVVLSGQLVISEISYNPPESGNDSLEYIEIYNSADVDFNLEGTYFSAGVDHVFGPGSIPANGYICICIDSSALMNVFGKSCLQWTGGALRNGGELISISDVNDVVLDAVEYGNMSPWPTSSDGTNGNGASIVLCDLESDNALGENWSAAKNSIGVEINGRIVRGSPGDDNVVSCVVDPDYTVMATPNNVFSPKDLTISVGETVRWINAGGNHNVNGDKSEFPDNPESFGNGSPSPSAWTYDFTFFNPGVYDYQCDAHANFGMTGTITVGQPITYPRYSIAELRGVDANGKADSLGITCEVQGVVHGINYSTSGGLLFFLIEDGGAGISIFHPNSNLGYSVNEGDLLTVRGKVEQFNGLTQLAADVIVVEGTANPFAPSVIDSLEEVYEGSLVTLEFMTLEDPSDWRGDGSSFNARFTNGNYTATVRISEFTDLANQQAPQGTFNITGFCNQFDFTEPYFEFYQLMPRSSNDFTMVSSTDDVERADIVISPNPASTFISIGGAEDVSEICFYTASGALLKVVANPPKHLPIDLETGSYIVSVRTGERMRFERLIVVR